MRRSLLLCISLVLTAFSCSSTLSAYTVTFDDVPTGKDLSYYLQQHGLDMVPGWEVIDSVSSGWGTPHSGTQAVVWNGNPIFAAGFGFGIDGVSEYRVRSVGAYFSAEPGVLLEMRGYTASGVVTARIGESDVSWSNRYVQIDSSVAGDILFVHIAGLNSPDDRYHFAMDDLTVVPIPEPATFLALAAGLVALAMRKRRR